MGINIGEILGSNIGKIFKDIVGSFKADPTKKLEFQAAIDANEALLAQKELELQALVENHITKEIEARKDIIVAEMNQGDGYTKRARPTIIYAGLGFIFLNHVLPAIVLYFGGRQFPIVNLPKEFWDAWTIVVSVWAVGRSVERIGVKNKFTGLITGNK